MEVARNILAADAESPNSEETLNVETAKLILQEFELSISAAGSNPPAEQPQH